MLISRSTPPSMFVALGLLALCGLLSACATDPAPAPVMAAPAPTPRPTPVPSEYVNISIEQYRNNAIESEKVPAALAAETESLRAAAVRQLFSDPMTRQPLLQARVCFLGVGANKKTLQDPSPALLGSIRNIGSTIKKYSECTADSQSVRDLATGGRGVLIKVCRICWTGPGHAMLDYGYITGGIKGQMTIAEAELSGGAWKITDRFSRGD